MTDEQIEQFSWITEFASSSGAMIVNATREHLYDVLGIGNLYLAILCIIAVLVAVTARCRPHLTADTAGSRFPAELVFLMMLFLSVGLHMNVVSEVYYISEIVGMTEEGIFCTVFAAMLVLFGVWYWGAFEYAGTGYGFWVFCQKKKSDLPLLESNQGVWQTCLGDVEGGIYD